MKTLKEIRGLLAETLKDLRKDYKLMTDYADITYDVGYMNSLCYILGKGKLAEMISAKFMNEWYMKAFKFILPDRTETIDSMSFKKAVKSFQNKYPDLKEVMINYINKKKHKIMRLVKLPIGRKKRIGRWVGVKSITTA